MNDRNDRLRRALEAVDLDLLIDDALRLVRIPSLGGEESAAQEHVARRLRELGAQVETWEIDLPTLREHPSFSAEIERTEASGVLGRWGRGDGRRLILNGHVDVVPVGDLARWTTPPFEPDVRDGRIYGRGAVDMKGGLCCALHALRAVHEAGVDLAGEVLIQSVVGEEDGGTGTLDAVLRLRERGEQIDGAVILEPTDRALIAAQAGAVNFRLSVPGRAAHGCVRTEGRSAIEAFEPLHRALLDLERERNVRFTDPLMDEWDLAWPLSIGMLRAGDWPSSVPDLLIAEGRYGVALGESLDDARLEFEDRVASVAAEHPWLREHPPTVEWRGGTFESARTDPSAEIVRAMRSAHAAIHGDEPRLAGVPYGADMRLLINDGGIPTVMYGPGDVRIAHAVDEFVPIGDLEAVVKTLIALILDFCG